MEWLSKMNDALNYIELNSEGKSDAPKGLFLVGDVVLNEFNDGGTIDIGSSMKKSSQNI
jgi:hypothetical protein